MKRLRIELLAPPYSGHLHPVLAIALQLAPEHDVVVLGTPAAQAAIASCGVPAATVLTAMDDEVLRAIANPGHAVGWNPLRLHAQLRQALALMGRLRAALDQRWSIERPDLVIADFTLPPAGLLAQSLGIPWWTSLPSPCVLETPDGPPPYLGGMRPARSAAASIGHAAARRATRLFKKGVHRLHRRRMAALGLPSLYRPDGTEAVYSPDCVLALGVPELEFPRTWPAALRFVGPMLCTPPSPHPEPPFVPGARHLLVTCGTHLDHAKDRLSAAAQALARLQPQWQVHVSDGRVEGSGAAQQAGTPGNFHRLAFVDYARHLSRYDLIVHHGGAGVMYHALAAGIPSLVFPLDYDQFDHAARLEACGAAVWLRRLEDLPDAFARAASTPGMFGGLAALQRAVQACRQAAGVRELVREWADRSPRSLRT